jgi:hypothetical protein
MFDPVLSNDYKYGSDRRPLTPMQESLIPIVGILLNIMGIVALFLVLGYIAYGEEEEE